MINPSTAKRSALGLLAAVPMMVSAACLNPFGCEPQTQNECIKEAAGAKTEAAAKALLAECRRLPAFTLSQCKKEERLWAQYLVRLKGVEWDWPGRSTKAEYRKLFAETFMPALWVSREYCLEKQAHLTAASFEVDKNTHRSKHLEQLRRTTPELQGLSDTQAIDFLQVKYYADYKSKELAAAVFLDRRQTSY